MARKGKYSNFSRWNADPFNQTAFENNAAYTEYFLKILDIALNRFKWHGLPPSVDERYFEMMLTTQGSAIFFNDLNMGYLTLGAAYESNLNYYGVPTQRQAIAANGKPFINLDEKNSVLVFNNRLRTADSPIIYIYANRLWELQRQIETNAQMQKFTNIIVCSQEERLSMEQLMMKWKGNQPIVYATKGLNMDNFKTLNFETPFVANQILEIKQAIYNEALTSLGVFNSYNNKRERLTSTESISMNGAIELTRQSYLNARQKAAEEINAMFGLNISVEFNTDILLAPEDMRKGGDEENGELYSKRDESD